MNDLAQPTLPSPPPPVPPTAEAPEAPSPPSGQKAKPKVKKKRRPYVKTPARLAAARANLAKARAAGKERIYRPTEKRLAANRANLAKAQAARRQDLELMVEHLHVAFPPLNEKVAANPVGEDRDSQHHSSPGQPSSSENRQSAIEDPGTVRVTTGRKVGRNEPCPCGSGKKFKKCCRLAAAPPPPREDPKTDTPRPEGEDPAAPDDGAERKVWVMGWPDGYPGVDPAGRDYAAMEEAGRAILHRQRAILHQGRREAQRVMRLLRQAAQRTTVASLEDILSLAGSLMAALAHSRFLKRAERLNERAQEWLEAFLEKRYEKPGILFGWRGILHQAIYPEGPARPDPTRHRRGRKAKGKAGVAREGAGASRPAPAPPLPETLEEFQALVYRAFCAPHPEPDDWPEAHLLDRVARSLWERLHLFEKVCQEDAGRLEEVWKEADQRLPADRQELMERNFSIVNVLNKEPAGGRVLTGWAERIRGQLGLLMRQRYGIHSEIDHFLQKREE